MIGSRDVESTRKHWKVLSVAVLLLSLSVLIIPPSFEASQILTNGRIWNSGIAIDSEGSIAYVGSTAGFSDGQALAALLKYSPTGQLTCLKTFGGSRQSPLDTFGYGVAFDSSNNMYVTGSTQTFGGEDYDVFLLKFDSSCNLVSTLQWGGPRNDIPRSIAVDLYDNVFIAGYTDSFGNGQTQVFLLKYQSADNEFVWSKFWGGANNDYGMGVDVDIAGNIYVTGYTNSFGVTPGISNVFLLKYDSSGNLLYQKTWGGTHGDFGSAVATDAAGNVYVTGYTDSFGVTPGISNVFLLKYDSSGNLLYQKTWGGTQNDFGYGVTVDGASNVYVTGYTYSSSVTHGLASVFILKYDPSGNLLFQNTWGGRKSDYGYGISVDPAAGYIYVTGYTFSFGSPNSKGVNVFLLKYDPAGNLLFQKTYGGGTPDP